MERRKRPYSTHKRPGKHRHIYYVKFRDILRGTQPPVVGFATLGHHARDIHPGCCADW